MKDTLALEGPILGKEETTQLTMNSSPDMTSDSIEIIAPFDGRGITTALFDFDGTLSRERDGWINLMVATNAAAMASSLPDVPISEIFDWTINDIEQTIGIPTFQQMKRLAEAIRSRAGIALSPQRYKDVYNTALVAMVKSVHRQVELGQRPIEDLRVSGAIELLSALAEKLGHHALFLASGTDIEPVKESVQRLGFGPFFEDRIIASGFNGQFDDCPKLQIINQLVRERQLGPGQLLTFGDGVPEIEYTVRTGGIAVGVLTPDQSHYKFRGHFTLENKRQRLIRAGAHVLVSDFREARKLINLLFTDQKSLARPEKIS